MMEKRKDVRKSHRKEAPLELGLKRTVLESRARRAERGQGGGRQGR